MLDVDRYTIEDTQRALVLGVRELDQAGINASDQNWSNLHTVYTHGSGVIAAYANQRPEDNGPEPTVIQWAEGQEPDRPLPSCSPTGTRAGSTTASRAPTTRIVGKASADCQDVELDLGNVAEGEDAGSGRPRRRTTATAVSRSAASSAR